MEWNGIEMSCCCCCLSGKYHRLVRIINPKHAKKIKTKQQLRKTITTTTTIKNNNNNNIKI